MPIGRRGPTLTGADYLIAIADDAREKGHPFADKFAGMIFNCFTPQGPFVIQAEAKRPLKAHEASPVSVIMGAYELAHAHRDRDAMSEVLRLGLSLLAKWPTYLAISADGHPELMLRSPEGEHGQDPQI